MRKFSIVCTIVASTLWLYSVGGFLLGEAYPFANGPYWMALSIAPLFAMAGAVAGGWFRLWEKLKNPHYRKR